MTMIDKEVLVELIERFLNERGLWYSWKEFIEKQGYDIYELGFKDE